MRGWQRLAIFIIFLWAGHSILEFEKFAPYPSTYSDKKSIILLMIGAIMWCLFRSKAEDSYLETNFKPTTPEGREMLRRNLEIIWEREKSDKKWKIVAGIFGLVAFPAILIDLSIHEISSGISILILLGYIHLFVHLMVIEK